MLVACSVETFTFEGDSASDAATNSSTVIPGAEAIADQSAACASGGVCAHTVTIVGEENGDGVVSPGETVTLEVQMINNGAVALSGVYARLTSVPDEAYVTDCSATTLCPGACGCTSVQAVRSLGPKVMSRALRFQLKADRATFKSPLMFGIVVSDEMGHMWPDQFAVVVQESAANVGFSAYRVVKDNNDDLKVSPGDEVTIAVYARNEGRAAIAGLSATMSKVPEGVVLTACSGAGASCSASCTCEPAASNVNIAVGVESANSVLQFTAQVGAQLSLSPLSFEMTLSDRTGRSWPVVFTIPVVASGAKVAVASQNIVSDPNRNMRLERGETAIWQIFASNTGTSTVRGLVTRLASVPNDVTIVSCGSTRGVCPGACECNPGSGDVSLRVGARSTGPVLQATMQVSQTAVSPLPLKVVFEDDAHNTWSQDINIEVF